VLRKLATDFGAAYSRKRTDATLRVRFVSNQPVHDAVLSLIDCVRSGTLPPEFDSVRQATGLSDDMARAFLTALDMSECGSTTRFAEEEALVVAIANLREGTALVDLNNMLGQIGRLMLPESPKQVITQMTVLTWLGISDIKALFPIQSGIELVNNPVTRASVKYLADKLMNGSQLVCFHGKGGSGKTTALQQLQAALPSGSVLVTYDCFGAGRYMAAEDQRHLPRKAFLQIANAFAESAESTLE
jgi:hypothetical protein